mgnify:CR=1 FL=1
MLLYFQYPSWLRPEVIPGLPIRWYGVMYLVAFVITYVPVSYTHLTLPTIYSV